MILGLLCSGNLGYKTLVTLFEKRELVFVCTDKKSDTIISFCDKNNITLFVGNPRNGKASEYLKNLTVDVIISVNYLFLIEEDLIRFANNLAFNIHGSLLPKYRGRTPHVWSIINNEKTTGITAHIIDTGCDTGAVLEQIEVPINKDDTGATILKKYATLYTLLIEKVLNQIETNSLDLKQQDERLATYFGKRTPRDGLINWNWSKERIKNWVRAQANPYPGAFTFYNDTKIIIDEVVFSNFGFDFNMSNGTILNVNPNIIKTANGAIEIIKTREKLISLEQGKQFTNENR
jgi:methionyl-tRNA formyltransferase